MLPSLNTFTHTLLEATLNLYPSNPDGTPQLTSPIWVGVQAEHLSIRERWLKTETRPTASRFPRKHPLVQQWEVNIGRVWALQELNPAGPTFSNQYYVLDVVWVDEDTHYWHRETFYNVSISERSRSSRNIDEGFTDEQVFDAEYVDPPSGGNGTVPSISETLPLVVRWVGTDGTLDLYRYDATSHNFTEAVTGISSGRATIAYSPNQSGSFSISFNGVGTPALQVHTDGTVIVGSLFQGAPLSGTVPRLDFFYGPTRIASLASDGTFYSASFDQATPAPGAGEFQIYSNSTLQLTLAATAATADVFQTS